MENQVALEKKGNVAIITLNRPRAANALSLQMLQELNHYFQDLSFDDSVRTLIITGAGDKVFCAGADLKERAGMDPVQVKKTVALIRKTVEAVEKLPQPVIAAMNGSALGGGLELALACDIRVAAEDGKYGLPETSLAIIPGAGGTQRLPRLIGAEKAKELIFTSKKISGREAEQIGLVSCSAQSAEVLSVAQEIAGKIAENGPVALKQAKKAVNAGLETDLNTGLTLEEKCYEVIIPTKDRLEGLQAFKEKRKPQYSGK
ncbi:enoyl-CoA hydratase [Thalassobacillus sp. C254]|uniref:enoyl-CoA hydratase n=1 Tax=Thalassobacillus sp. C254 TaxID=1225341 RepID=UPI0006D16988|nr:enoyl-CoA hydratase [Thalassobacillus sp. C254]